jgi:hypothetical protein
VEDVVWLDTGMVANRVVVIARKARARRIHGCIHPQLCNKVRQHNQSLFVREPKTS